MVSNIGEVRSVTKSEEAVTNHKKRASNTNVEIMQKIKQAKLFMDKC